MINARKKNRNDNNNKANDIVIIFICVFFSVNFRNKMEVQADVSASETASAVTCVSEKSSNTQNDNASTRALAGSMYKQVNKPNQHFPLIQIESMIIIVPTKLSSVEKQILA